MKTCPSCGGEFQDRFLYCVRDGTRLEPIAPESVAEIVPAKKTGPVAGVLYCPACSGEYPLTFSACPLDSLPLTREKPSANLQQVFALEVPEAHSIKTLPVAPEIEVAVQQTALAERPDTGSYQVARITDSIAVEAVAIPETADLSDEPDELPDTDYLGDGDEDLEDGNELSGDADEEPRGLRMAAIILSSALILLVLGGLYMFISIAARAPMSSAITAVESKASAAPGPVFVPTPRAAMEYTEEASEAANPANQPPAGKAALMAENSGRRGQQDPVINGPESRKIAKAQEKSPPVAADGRVSTRLVRVRARRTSRGYRYDLTFSMKEQAGRPIRWNLLAINSRSARGLSRSETIRVKDRISPGGALTFTVSVEMPGRVPADWRGRVTITSIGIDGAGRSVRAVYGAEVAP